MPQAALEIRNQTLMQRGSVYVATTYGRSPIALVRGEGTRVWDADGKLYYDFLSGLGVNNLGHCHPKVVEAIRQQAGLLLHVSNLYHIQPQIELAEMLAQLSFADRSFFCNSGTEACEAAIKLARKYSHDHFGGGRYEIITMERSFHGRTSLAVEMPLRELMRGFFDKIKSVSSGLASLSYEISGYRSANVTRLDVLVGEKLVPAFSRIVWLGRVQHEAEATVEKLKNILPRQLVTVKIQARSLGRIIAARSIAARRKDVTGYLYGGDISRKKKLWQKQKKGKKRLQERFQAAIPSDVFVKMMRAD